MKFNLFIRKIPIKINQIRLQLFTALIFGLAFVISAIQASQAVEISDEHTFSAALNSSTETIVLSEKKSHVSTGRVRFAQVQDSGLVENGLLPPSALPQAVDAAQQAYALQFWQEFGRDFGITDPAAELSLLSQTVDTLGETHLRYQQYYKRVPVFGAQLMLHYDINNRIKVVNGLFIPELSLDSIPTINSAAAAAIALTEVAQNPLGNLLATPTDLHTHGSELFVYRTNLARGKTGVNYLAYIVEVVAEPFVREQLVVNAHKGTIIERIDMVDRMLNRTVYDGQSGSILWAEGNSLPYSGMGSADVNNQIEFSEDIYNLMWTLSGGTFDSWNGSGTAMESIYNANIDCPNATWNGATANFCPGVTSDDIVAHEWAHAYTEGTHDLIYAWQAGALNEAYSDIWGETADLLNGAGTDDADGVLRTNGFCAVNDSPTRWLIGEDSAAFNGAIRDMWLPSCFGDPDNVTDDLYFCDTGDSGGVHINSGVPNHAYALLVDGGIFNGQAINGIGLTKAAHIYWRGQTIYQSNTSNFVDHADALAQSCQDLIGASISELSTDSIAIVASNEQISAADCAAVDAAIAAVELLSPTTCNYTPNLVQNPPALCEAPDTYAQIFGTDWEGGPGPWSIGTYGITGPGTFDTPNWSLNSNLPDARSGIAAFVPNDSNFGNCADDDETGVLFLQSPPITIPAEAGALGFAFDHWFATEAVDDGETEGGIDGGNVKVSINGGNWVLVPTSAFLFNAYNSTIIETFGSSQITTPLAGEDAFSGTDDGSVGGSWGQSQIDLSNFAAVGDTVQVRFEMGQDGCTGVKGWYVDEVDLYQCVAPPTPTPTETAISMPTKTATPTPTATPVPTAIPTETVTSTSTPTDTPTLTPTETATPTPTATETLVPLTPTSIATPTATETSTSIPTSTSTNTLVPTATETAIPTETATPILFTPTATKISIPPTGTPTEAPTSTATNTVVPTATETAIPTETATPIPFTPGTLVPPTAISTETPTAAATNTVVPATTIFAPTSTPVLMSATWTPSDTAVPVTNTSTLPTNTPVFAAINLTPTKTSAPTKTLVPLAVTSVPPTATLTPTDTSIPPTVTVPPTTTSMRTIQSTPTTRATITPTPFTGLIRLTVQDTRTSAVDSDNSVISWLFMKDEQTSGFDVYRSTSPTSDDVTDTILVGSIREIEEGNKEYSVTDDALLPAGSYYYWVSQVTKGGTILYGPIVLNRSSSYNLFLPLIDQ